MKNKFIYLILFSLGFFACDDLTDINVNPKAATKVEAVTLFSNAQKNLVDQMTTPSVNTGIFRLLSQYWTETTYTDESRYDLNTRNIPRNFWNVLYRDVLRDLKEASDLAAVDPSINEATRANQQAQSEILAVYTWLALVATFGDIPYSESLDFNKSAPVYDDAATIIDDLVSRLDQAIANISEGDSGFDGGDLLYGGDLGAWKKFANGIKLRIGLLLADQNSAKAATIIQQAATNVFTSNADNAVFQYLSSPPNTNPIWVNLVQSGRQDFVVANTLVDYMESVNDPRIPLYFTKDADGGYSGGIYGTSNNYATFSKPSDAIQAPDFEALLMDYAEIELSLAEAAARGIAVGGTAEEHYNKGIEASILYWGGSAGDVTSYLANPAVAYTTAAGDFKQKIGYQKWLALYNRGFEAWIDQRRLDYPVLNAPSEPLGSYPLRFTYPVDEQNLNKINYDAASSAIGGDMVTTRIFWDMQ
ncbi:MAG: SusD/RagB family nutrient-binding outer membrane lipoprotein [Microscillaceae bacterium]|nr:SusD/RagB family nutrient-binding outer membrane lipoprotein [Microscillaceae bacterium]